MNGTIVLALLGSLGGITAFCGAVVVIVKSGIKSVTAIRENTEAVRILTEAMGKLDRRVDQHDIDLAVLKDRKVDR